MSSDWLDRLWSSKGFSSTTHLDLDRFITSLPHHAHSHHPILPIDIAQQQTSNNQPSNAFTRITNALSDLFCVGDPIPHSSSFPAARRRKSPRKQPNPMHYLVTNSHINTHCLRPHHQSVSPPPPAPPTVTVSLDNSNSGLGGLLTVLDGQVKLVENFMCAQDKEDADNKGCPTPTLDGFSRTEVTVIDTSFAGWKFENFLFRKNDTWKARDKKGTKSTVALGMKKKKKKKKKKKRKALVTAKEKYQGKKLKVLHQGSSMLKTGSSGCNQEHLSCDKQQAACTKASGAVDIVSKKQQSTTNLLEGSSSIVRIKSAPTGKKSGTSFSRSCVDPSQKETNE